MAQSVPHTLNEIDTSQTDWGKVIGTNKFLWHLDDIAHLGAEPMYGNDKWGVYVKPQSIYGCIPVRLKVSETAAANIVNKFINQYESCQALTPYLGPNIIYGFHNATQWIQQQCENTDATYQPIIGYINDVGKTYAISQLEDGGKYVCQTCLEGNIGGPIARQSPIVQETFQASINELFRNMRGRYTTYSDEITLPEEIISARERFSTDIYNETDWTADICIPINEDDSAPSQVEQFCIKYQKTHNNPELFCINTSIVGSQRYWHLWKKNSEQERYFPKVVFRESVESLYSDIIENLNP